MSSKASGKPSCQGAAMVFGLISLFKKYAEKDQDKEHLSKAELKEMLQNEFPGLIDESDPASVNKIMAALDNDKDGQVNINEYMITLCALGIAMYDALNDLPKKK